MFSIGSHRSCPSHILQQFGLTPFRDILPPKEFETVATLAGCEPSRKRTLIPEVVFWLMAYVGLEKQSMTQGLTQAWGMVRAVCPEIKESCVTESAFSQARARVPLRFWRALWNRLRQAYEDKFPSCMLWKNKHRVLAGDGSEVDLPNMPEIVEHFGRPKNGKGSSLTPQARLVALCSVFTGFCIAFTCTALGFTEHDALRHLIRRLRLNDLLLLDRGFFSLRRDGLDPRAQGRLPHAPLEPSGGVRPAT